ncbi:MAG: hypothetical protein ABIU29_06375 [Chthoniobacterales bacterium]
MTSVRALISQIKGAEEQLLVLRETESRVSYHTSLVAQWVTPLLGLGLVLLGFLLAKRELETRARGLEALARANNELEGRVVTRTAALAEANESLQRNNRELDQFASVASHDLQEPLRKIEAFGDRLQARSAAELG